MRLNEIVKGLIKKSGYTQRGVRHRQGPASRHRAESLRQREPQDGHIGSRGQALGYAVAVVPSGSKLPDGSFVLSMSDPNAPIDDRRTGSHVKIYGGYSDELIG